MLPQSDFKKKNHQKTSVKGNKYLELGFAPGTTLDRTTAAYMKGDPIFKYFVSQEYLPLSWHSIHLSSTRTGLKK
jgi:hypothetical protein